MLPKINPTSTNSWSKLHELSQKSRPSIRALFNEDQQRVNKFTKEISSLLFDFSKSDVSNEEFNSLMSLSRECDLAGAIKSMFEGDSINETEDRAVQHIALRNPSSTHSPLVEKELDKIKKFSEELNSQSWKGYSGKPITNIVNIGIGGSDLGPKMVTNALRPYWKHIKPHFVSNVDAQQLVEELEGLNAETTLFIIASKTFTTQETMTNAASAKDWFLKNGGNESDIAKHFVAVSTNTDAVTQFGIDPANMFVFWDWVGGRYSLWSAIGLSIACTVGFDCFKDLLSGANHMDNHFNSVDLEDNIPVIAALIGIWYNNFLKYDSYAILPYDHRLQFLPSYLQQADMESNGKYVDRNGDKIGYETGPIIWGEPGTNGQHAFYQLIHQGTKVIPCDFIAAVNPSHDHIDHHQKLLSNFLAQPEALLNGKTKEQVEQELEASGTKNSMIIPFKVFEGNRPSTSILMDELSPFNLGMLIAFYEHKIFVQGAIWNIFSFDQWGVELGKQLAKPILQEIKSGDIGSHDPSTSNLLKKIQG